MIYFLCPYEMMVLASCPTAEAMHAEMQNRSTRWIFDLEARGHFGEKSSGCGDIFVGKKGGDLVA